MTVPPIPEFSRPISVTRLTGEAALYRIAAKPEEAAGLASRFDIPAVHRLEADVTLRRLPGGDVSFIAEFRASVTQTCVVTLEPLDIDIAEGFTLLFRPGIDEDEADRLALEAIDDEVIEPLIDDVIDIGEVVAQQLSLALDPYPRAPDVIEDVLVGAGDDDQGSSDSIVESPFASLSRLMKS